MVHGHWSGGEARPGRAVALHRRGEARVLRARRRRLRRGRAGRRQGARRVPRRADRRDPACPSACRCRASRSTRTCGPSTTCGPAPRSTATTSAITGASGGGNQSMYAGAWDDRIKAVVPVCSVGNYQAYLGAACCMCEVVPGALRFTEEWGVLGLVAPRGPDGRQRDRRTPSSSPSPSRTSRSPWPSRSIKLFDKAGQPPPHRLRIEARLQPPDARGHVRLDDPPPQGRRRRVADPRARDQDRRPRSPPLLPGRLPAPTTS